ncbi:polyprenyl synthetase family protein [Streptomyces violascens]|uniref:polyprenyl synthetase family protein n=1 Tax=Streptomyces violascens TaxID=67381 RepID=UPI00379C81A1
MLNAVEHHIIELHPSHADPGRLGDWIPPQHLGGVGRQIRARLSERVHKALTVPVREVTDAGGRRWRPMLVGQVITLLGEDAERFAPVLAALEIAHAGSLIVDDIEDAAPMRRGRPAAHTVHGLPTALNAGTNAYFALDNALRRCVPDDPLLRGRLYEVYLQALRAAHTGQALDIQGHSRDMDQAVVTGNADTLLQLVRLTHRLKSGAMVAAGFEMAALLTGVDPRLRQELAAFGSAVGTAYQIGDDAADLRGVTRGDVRTKRAAEDLHNGKTTMPLAHAVHLLPRERLRTIWQWIRDGTASDVQVSEILTDVEGCGAGALCTAEAQEMVERAWDRLHPLLPASTLTDLLYDSARLVVNRDTGP